MHDQRAAIRMAAGILARIPIDSYFLRVLVSDAIYLLSEMGGMDDEFLILGLVDQSAEEHSCLRPEIRLAFELGKREGEYFDVFCRIIERFCHIHNPG